jgi:CheY-like chemotaxis protein
MPPDQPTPIPQLPVSPLQPIASSPEPTEPNDYIPVIQPLDSPLTPPIVPLTPSPDAPVLSAPQPEPQPNIQPIPQTAPQPIMPLAAQAKPLDQAEQFGVHQKIVIVEDNIALADVYKTRLELLGYKCFSAYDGEAALSIIEHQLPDLVLLDLMVPKIAGDEILKRMRSSNWGKDIKVYIISNLNEEDAPAGLREQGIEGYAVKANLSNDQLDQLVDSVLKPADQTEDIILE